MPAEYWSAKRIAYRSMCELLSQVDDAITLITMVVMSKNLFFICVELLSTVE